MTLSSIHFQLLISSLFIVDMITDNLHFPLPAPTQHSPHPAFITLSWHFSCSRSPIFVPENTAGVNYSFEGDWI